LSIVKCPDVEATSSMSIEHPSMSIEPKTP